MLLLLSTPPKPSFFTRQKKKIIGNQQVMVLKSKKVSRTIIEKASKSLSFVQKVNVTTRIVSFLVYETAAVIAVPH